MKTLLEVEVREASKRKVAVRVCNHCGGHLRFYQGSFTCLMCGRDVDHSCKDCLASHDLLVETT